MRISAVAWLALAAAFVGLTAATTASAEPPEIIDQCKTCHGVNGLARIPTAPHIAGTSRGYLEQQLKDYKSGKRAHEVMSVIAEDLTRDDMKAAAKWYSSLKITVELPE